MPTPTLIFELDARDAVRELKDQIDDQIRQWLVRTAETVAAEARGSHPWQNRTGELQANTRGSRVVEGDFWNDTLVGEVLGETSYGEFLEENPTWAWLLPAWQANEASAVDELDAALGRAAHDAGW